MSNYHTGCGACGNVLCSTQGCQRYKFQNPYPAPNFHYVATVPVGCICPPTSEQTCLNDRCPRKPWKPYAITTVTAAKQENL